MKVGDRYQFGDLKHAVAGFVGGQVITRYFYEGKSVYEMRPAKVVEGFIKNHLWVKLPG